MDECLWKVFQNLPDVGNVVNSQGHEGNSGNTRYTYSSEDTYFPTYTGILQRTLREDSIIYLEQEKSEFPPTICLDLNLGGHFVLAHLYIKDCYHSP